MYHIKTLNKISPYGMDVFDRSKYICGDHVEAPNGILVRSAAMHDMELGSELAAIAQAQASTISLWTDAASRGSLYLTRPAPTPMRSRSL